MIRFLSFLYGLGAYVIFLGTFLYAIGFVSGLIVPKTVDSGNAPTTSTALIANLLLMSLFAVQHSGMARRGFKRILTRVVSPVIERSTYVLAASSTLILLFAFWQPMPETLWAATNPTAGMVLQGLSALGWLIVLYSTFLISHFELFGLRQVVMNFVDGAIPAISFKTPGLYRVIRHPIYLGFIIAFWATPVMTWGHALFAAVTTAYIFVGIWLEERDLVALFGEQYRRYRERVAMLFPGII